jgi:hypothetical protein
LGGRAGALPGPRRQFIVNLMIAAIVLGSTASLITGREYFPFSPYSIFADLQGPQLVQLDVVGILASEPGGEVSLAPSRRTAIVSGKRYEAALERLVERGDEREIREYLATAARRYDDDHQRAAVSTLRTVRLYKSRWAAVPQEWPPARRVDRQLLAEIDPTH